MTLFVPQIVTLFESKTRKSGWALEIVYGRPTRYSQTLGTRSNIEVLRWIVDDAWHGRLENCNVANVDIQGTRVPPPGYPGAVHASPPSTRSQHHVACLLFLVIAFTQKSLAKQNPTRRSRLKTFVPIS